MRIALDTNRLIDLFQGDASLAAFLGTCDEVWIPFVVLAEMKAGFYGGNGFQTRDSTKSLPPSVKLTPTSGNEGCSRHEPADRPVPGRCRARGVSWHV